MGGRDRAQQRMAHQRHEATVGGHQPGGGGLLQQLTHLVGSHTEQRAEHVRVERGAHAAAQQELAHPVRLRVDLVPQLPHDRRGRLTAGRSFVAQRRRQPVDEHGRSAGLLEHQVHQLGAGPLPHQQVHPRGHPRAVQRPEHDRAATRSEGADERAEATAARPRPVGEHHPRPGLRRPVPQAGERRLVELVGVVDDQDDGRVDRLVRPGNLPADVVTGGGVERGQRVEQHALAAATRPDHSHPARRGGIGGDLPVEPASDGRTGERAVGGSAPGLHRGHGPASRLHRGEPLPMCPVLSPYATLTCCEPGEPAQGSDPLGNRSRPNGR
ncbi:hypothetical protein GCM10009559_33620 [Pseudonocardia zijingensis]|uniref:Uncharacterized protein n=1 Tax=Pseudonocardia zijingensis TaxID=153376 RepID=A0ABN1Q9V5_9PSEU